MVIQNDGMITIPRKKRCNNPQGVVGLTPDALDCLNDVAQDTGMPVKTIASLIIVQAVRGGLISYEDA